LVEQPFRRLGEALMSEAISARPPSGPRGLAWVRANFFATPLDAVLTLGAAALALWIGWSLLRWGVLDATWTGTSRLACHKGGACWAMITARWPTILAGAYPRGHLWRPALAVCALGLSLAPLVLRRAPAWTVALTPAGVVLALAVMGGAGVLPRVPTDYWGGFLLNILIGVTGAVLALPLGTLLAYGRRSRLPAVRIICTAFIELVRAAPLITVLFMASVMLPLFLPEGVSLNRLARAMTVIVLFESAYMAETVRGGLQAVPDGQREAAKALGLNPLQTALLVVLPQALRIAIPAIVNSFIGLFKDTTLVFVIALLDITGVLRQALADPVWEGLDLEGYVVIAIAFWIPCFAMSRWAAALEKRGAPRPGAEPA
jgi:general L-amino acid transport system permease protein